jgi:hypothetical protein
MKFLTVTCLLLLSLSSFASDINVPATNILAAARSIVSQTGPHYAVKGLINCTLINSGWGPSTANCTIKIKGVEVQVEQPETIITSVMEVSPPTGPYYSFAGKFKAVSISSELPPYEVSETATVLLK